MIPLRLVVDTNIIVSVALKPDGLERTIVLLTITKPARLYYSDAIFSEYRSVLAPLELRIRKGLQHQLLALIEDRAHIISPTLRLEVTTDPDDNIFLERSDACARRLPDNRQPAAFPEILEADQRNHLTRVYRHRCAASYELTQGTDYKIYRLRSWSLTMSDSCLRT